MKFVFDLDGTICTEKPTFERSLALPVYTIISYINRLYNRGDTIIIYTARGWQEYEMTAKWLKDNNVNYHILMMGKVHYDYWVDDRSCNPYEDLEKLDELVRRKA